MLNLHKSSLYTPHSYTTYIVEYFFTVVEIGHVFLCKLELSLSVFAQCNKDAKIYDLINRGKHSL